MYQWYPTVNRWYHGCEIIILSILSSCTPNKPNLPQAKIFITDLNIINGVGQDLAWDTQNEIDTIISKMVEAKVQAVRLTFRWSEIEKSKGQFDYSLHDKIVKKLVENNIAIVGLLISVPSWANGYALDTYPPDDINDWVNFVSNIAKRYKNQIKGYFIFNEPNIEEFWKPQPNPQLYAEYLKSSYKTIKSIDTSILVICGGIAGNGIKMEWEDDTEANFIQKIYDNGGKGYYDALSIHPYIYPNDIAVTLQELIDKINKAKSLMLANSDSAILWIDEIGWSDSTTKVFGYDPVSRNQIADWLTAVFSGDLEIPVIFWYNFKDIGEDPTNAEHGYGLLDFHLHPKPAFTNFMNISRTK